MIQRVKIIANDGDTATLESVPCTCGRAGCEGIIEPTITRNILVSSRAQFLADFRIGKLVEIDQDNAEDVDANKLADAESQRRYKAFIKTQGRKS